MKDMKNAGQKRKELSVAMILQQRDKLDKLAKHVSNSKEDHYTKLQYAMSVDIGRSINSFYFNSKITHEDNFQA